LQPAPASLQASLSEKAAQNRIPFPLPSQPPLAPSGLYALNLATGYLLMLAVGADWRRGRRGEAIPGRGSRDGWSSVAGNHAHSCARSRTRTRTHTRTHTHAHTRTHARTHAHTAEHTRALRHLTSQVMTYNVGYFLVVVLSMGAGHLLFFSRPWHLALPRTDACCETSSAAHE
jgi:hypothetical protein